MKYSKNNTFSYRPNQGLVLQKSKRRKLKQWVNLGNTYTRVAFDGDGWVLFDVCATSFLPPKSSPFLTTDAARGETVFPSVTILFDHAVDAKNMKVRAT